MSREILSGALTDKKKKWRRKGWRFYSVFHRKHQRSGKQSFYERRIESTGICGDKPK
jgi:hypothetical protein